MWYCDSKYILCCYRNRCGDSYLPWLPRLHIIPFCRARQRALPHPWRTAFVNVTRCLRCISLSGCLESISMVPTASPGTRVNPATSAIHDRRALSPHSHLKREWLCPLSRLGSQNSFLFKPRSQTQNFQRSGKVRLHIKQQFAINKLSVCVGPMLLC